MTESINGHYGGHDATPPRIPFENARQAALAPSRFNDPSLVKGEVRAPVDTSKIGPDGEPARHETRRPSKEQIWKAIRAFCLECGGTAEIVKHCPASDSECNLRPFRFGLATHKRGSDGRLLKGFFKSSLLKEIRKQCVMCLESTDVTHCTSPRCRLYPYKHGTGTRIEEMLV